MTAATITRPDPLDTALRYLGLGFSVIPVKARDKRPALASWKEFQTRRATEDEVRSWFKNHDLNVALVTGAVSRIVAVDADDADAVAWMQAHHPSTMRARTGKGAHFLFRHPGHEVRNGAKLGGRALDVRGDGGYIVAPGSIHPTGALYREEGDWTAEPPTFQSAWLGDRVLPLVVPQAALERRVQAYIDAIPGEAQGGRDNQAYKVACKLVREFALTDETALGFLCSWNAKCDPPLPMGDLRRILTSAAKSGRSPLGSKLDPTPWAAPAPAQQGVAVDDGGSGDLRDLLTKTDKGGIKRTPGNLAKILRLDPQWGALLALNEMTRDLLYKGQVVGDVFVDWVQEQIEDHYGTAWGRDEVAAKLVAQATLQIIHPVREWMLTLTWDGTERIAKLAAEVLGNPEPLATHYLRCTMVGAVRRVMHPGTKVDTLPVLEGPQGIGKSTFWRDLFGEQWFSDSPIDLESKDGMMNLHRPWCTELSEIDHATSTKAAERIKGFLSSSQDVFRPPFAKAVAVFPRSCTLVATTNREGFLVDASGSRRFWPIKVATINLGRLAEWREQLWAEAIDLYKAEVPHWLTSVQEKMREEDAARFEVADPWSEELRLAIEALSRAGSYPSAGYTSSDLLTQMGIMVDRRNIPAEMRLASLMRKAGWVKRATPGDRSRTRRWFHD